MSARRTDVLRTSLQPKRTHTHTVDARMFLLIKLTANSARLSATSQVISLIQTMIKAFTGTDQSNFHDLKILPMYLGFCRELRPVFLRSRPSTPSALLRPMMQQVLMSGVAVGARKGPPF